jgi:hypothetical protein
MRKRTKRKVWPLINTVAHVIQGVSQTPEPLLDSLRTRELGAIDAFARGAASPADWHDINAMVGVCLSMAQENVGPEAIETCALAKQSLQEDWARYDKTGRMGTTGPGLQRYRDVYQYADLQRQSITREEYEKHITLAIKKVKFVKT